MYLTKLNHCLTNGSQLSFYVASQVHHLINSLSPTDQQMYSSFIKRHLLLSLKSSYAAIAKRYLTKMSESYTVEDILNSVKTEYEYNRTHNHSNSTHTFSTPQRSHHERNHTNSTRSALASLRSTTSQTFPETTPSSSFQLKSLNPNYRSPNYKYNNNYNSSCSNTSSGPTQPKQIGNVTSRPDPSTLQTTNEFLRPNSNHINADNNFSLDYLCSHHFNQTQRISI